MADFFDRATKPTAEYDRRQAAEVAAFRLSAPLIHAARLAIERENAAAAQKRHDERMNLDERRLKLDQERQALQARIQENALKEKQTAIDQAQGFLTAIDAASAKFGMGSKDFYAHAIAAAKNFPAAIHGDARIGGMLDHFTREFERVGGSPEMATALWELGQVNPKDKDALTYLRTIPGKYPGIMGDKTVGSVYNQALKEAERASQVGQVPPGMVPTGATQNAAGGITTTFKSPQANDSELKSLERERSLHASALDRAKLRRSKYPGAVAEDDPNRPFVDMFDEDIRNSTKSLNDVESQIRALRSPALTQDAQQAEDVPTPGITSPAAPAAKPAPTEDAAPSFKPLDEVTAKMARDAITAGASEKAIRQRLKETGYDESGL